MKDWFKDKRNVFTISLVYSVTFTPRSGSKTQPVDIVYAIYVAAAVLACAFMQVVVPVALLVDWTHSGDSFWNMFRLRPASSTAPEPPSLLDSATALDVRVLQPVWQRLCKGCVATYVLWLILYKDIGFARTLLHYSAHLCRTAPLKLLMAIQSFLYACITVLVYFVTIVLIARSTTISDVVLSGVSALFILEFDEVVGNMFEEVYLDHLDQMWEDLEELATDEAASGAEEGKVPGAESSEPAAPLSPSGVGARKPAHCWTPARPLHMVLRMLTQMTTGLSMGFWAYFLYRLERG